MGADPIGGSRQGQDEGKSMAWLPAQLQATGNSALREPRRRPARPMRRPHSRGRTMLIETFVTGFVAARAPLIVTGAIRRCADRGVVSAAAHARTAARRSATGPGRAPR